MIFWAFVGACRGKLWFDRNRSLKKMRWMEDRRGERRPSYLIPGSEGYDLFLLG
jgi:hypothetical protein